MYIAVTLDFWKNIQKMGFAHITARSVHYKQDKEKLEEFKKTLPEIKGEIQINQFFILTNQDLEPKQKLVLAGL
jgi:protein-arginine kinase